MGKVTSLYGKTTGKIGSIVFSTSGGETIAREYNPSVANPSTMPQVNQRARMKLMSQLSASLSPVIAMTKEGLVSKRNKFTKLNFDASMAENGIAQITYENIQLTEGSIGLPSIVAVRALESGVTIQLSESAADSVSRVVYIMYRKTAEQKLQLVSSVIVNAPGGGGTFPATLPYIEGDIVLYAYGMRDTNESATANYGNLQVANAVDIARLTAVRKISSEDYQFTQTRGATLFSGESSIDDVPKGSARVFVTALGGGNVSGAGIYKIGTTVQVGAAAPSGYKFVGWRLNGSNTIISTDPIYEFVLKGMTDLIAVFEVNQSAVTYNVTVRQNQTGTDAGATVSGGGQVVAGQPTTVVATEPPSGDYEFEGWYIATSKGTSRVSSELTYTFIPKEDTIITAGWKSASM